MPKPCLPGTFNPTSGSVDSDVCDECDAGLYSEIYGSDSCLECPLGFACSSGSRSVCPFGTYADETGLSSCVNCPAGFSCGVPSESPTICSPGTYSTGMATSCTVCPSGQFSLEHGSSSCDDCPSGSRCPSPSLSSYILCPPGSTSVIGSSSCFPCDSGNFSGAAGADSCKSCPPGAFCLEPGSVPIVCPPGTSSAGSQSECTPCSEGEYAASYGSTACTPCPAGMKCIFPNELPTPCPSGSFSELGAAACEDCSPGSYCLNPDSSQLCPVGMFSRGGLVTSCQLCPIGTFADQVGTAECEICPAGQSCLDQDQAPIPCGAGTFSPKAVPGCMACPPGTYSAAEAVECIASPAGSMSSNPALPPTLCSDGTFADLPNATECKQCPPGTYSSPDRTTCLECLPGNECSTNVLNPCLAGSYSMSGAVACTICPAGHSCANSAAMPLACESGTIAPPGSPACQDCPAGHSCGSPSGLPVLCPRGYNSSDGICFPCPAGYDCEGGIGTPCVSPEYSREGDGVCSVCPPGHECSSLTHARPCSDDEYATGGSASCTECPAGEFCPSTAQAPQVCPAGWYSVAGMKTCHPCPSGSECVTADSWSPSACSPGDFSVAGQAACSGCPVGYYCPEKSGFHPMVCPPGTYNEVQGANPVCQICPPGSFCLDPAEPPIPCDPGFYSLARQPRCTECPFGHDCTTQNQEPTPCPVNEWNPKGATGVCQLCPNGYQCFGGPHVPSPCPIGFWCENGMVIPCPEGTYGVQEGVSTQALGCAVCPAGRYCPLLTRVVDEHLVCPRGSFCPAQTPNSTAFICPEGTYNPNIGGVTENDCWTCPAGFYCPSPSPAGTETYSRRPCSPGTYCPAGSWDETPCPPGTYNPYQAKKNVSDCLQCLAGAYCLQGAFAVSPCSPGEYNPHPGSAVASNCLVCRPGRQCPNAEEEIGCPVGYYCLEGTHPGNPPIQCPAGTWSLREDLTRAEDCEICPEGFTCPLTGMVDCPVGYYCPGAPKEGQGHAQVFTLQTYNGEYATADPPPEFPCPPGTYGGGTGLRRPSDCTPCPGSKFCSGLGESTWSGDCTAGYYCPVGSSVTAQLPCPAGTFGNASIASEEECCDCPLGNWCSEASTSPTPCASGTYSNRTGLTRPGPIDDDDLACTPCPPGYMCGVGQVDPIECGKGYYSRKNASSCIDCPEGHYCPDNATTYENMRYYYECHDGSYCDVGVDREPDITDYPCPAGFYCPEATVDPLPCPAGTFNPSQSRLSRTDCIECPAGFYCEQNSTFPVMCSAGGYCPAGSYMDLQYLCPPKTYRHLPQAMFVLMCAVCPNGYYCDEGTVTPEICPQGYYCIHGTAQPEPCPIGTFGNTTGLIHEEFCSNCVPGRFCDGIGLTSPTGLCSAGHFCIEKAISAAPQELPTGGACPKGGYCPEGAESPFSCPPGTFNNETGAKTSDDCAACLPGSYCLGWDVPEPTGPCREGYYCDGEASDPEQHLVPPGFFSLAGSAAPIPCPPGTYNTETGRSFCDPCPAGDYCPTEITGSGWSPYSHSSPLSCPSGHYCELGSIHPTKCPPGTFVDLGLRRNVSQCEPCPTGQYCGEYGLNSPSGDCYAGYYCTGGASIPNDEVFGDVCPKGRFCPQGSSTPSDCPDGTYMPIFGSRASSDCIPCEPGAFCDASLGGLLASSGNCSDGFYCRYGAEVPNPIDVDPLGPGNECPVGHFCPAGSVSPLPCPVGTYQDQARKDGCDPCPVGQICLGGTETPSLCPAGSYCPLGTGYDIPRCPVGTFSPLTGLDHPDNCTLCSGGRFCSREGLVVPDGDCMPGFFCDSGCYDGTGNAIARGSGGNCTAGHYCETGTASCTECLPGTYSSEIGNEAAISCISCTPGSYCDVPAMTFVLPCAAGYYCDGGESVDDPHTCTPGSYCPEGSVFPQMCPSGNYSQSPGASVCDPCPAEQYCLANTTYPEDCPPGYYCPQGTGRLSEDQKCPPGTYSNQTGAQIVSSCSRCSGGNICTKSGLTAPDDVCPPGWYCTSGVIDYLGTVFPGGSFGPCPQGKYCPEGTLNPVACLPGTYSAEQGNIDSVNCLPCTPGQYCEDFGMDTPSGSCVAGWYCSLGATSSNTTVPSEGGECWEGHFCPSGSEIPVPCPEGFFGRDAGLEECLECPAGFYCPEATQEPVICPQGEFCPSGSGMSYCEDFDCAVGGPRGRCPPGSYGHAEQLSDVSNCTICSVGEYCSQEGLLSPDGSCLAGLHCLSGARLPDGTPGRLGGETTGCPPGFYCGVGTTSPVACSPGTFNPVPNMTEVTHCQPCLAGFYCSSQNLSAPSGECLAGYYCPPGQISQNSSEYICPTGHRCPNASVLPLGCPDGYYQDTEGQSDCLLCSAGYSCHSNASAETICNVTFYCEAGTAYPTKCPNGTYGNVPGLTSVDDCLPCDEGVYCVFGEVAGICLAGYWCYSGNFVPSPADEMCPLGLYCPEGTVGATVESCPNGTISLTPGSRTVQDCEPCGLGMYCPGNVVVLPCPEGYYCPLHSPPLPCPLGTYNPLPGAQNMSQCDACQPGYVCDSRAIGILTPSHECLPGFFCPEASITALPCAPGTYNPTSKGQDITACLVCPEGFKCGVGSLDPEPCSPGTYCAPGSSKEAGCPPGFYCPENTTFPVPCPPGYYCNASDTIKCEGAVYCLGNNTFPTRCPYGYSFIAGDHLRVFLSDSCDLCPPGTFMNDSIVNKTVCLECSDGFVCLGGATSGTPTDVVVQRGFMCPVGHYCPKGVNESLSCSLGTHQDEMGQKDCKVCPENHIADSDFVYCQSCGPHAVHVEEMVDGIMRKTGCRCVGNHRSYQDSDRSCVCLPGYGYFADFTPQPRDQDGDGDCIRLTHNLCENRDILGDCVGRDACDSVCPQGGEMRSGVCVCSSPSTSNCTESCQALRMKILIDGDQVRIVDGDSGLTLATFSSDVFSNGIFTCSRTQSFCEILVVISRSGNGYGAAVNPSEDFLLEFLGNMSSPGRRSLVVGEEVIDRPILCLEEGDGVTWDLRSEPMRFPVYVKDSILNTNPDFDYGSFRRLRDLVTRMNRTIPSFVHVFEDEGIYSFADYVDPNSVMIVKVVAFGGCSQRVFPPSEETLDTLSIYPAADAFIRPHWLVVGFMFISFSLASLAMISFAHYFCTCQWRRKNAILARIPLPLYLDKKNDMEESGDYRNFNVRVLFSELDRYSQEMQSAMKMFSGMFREKYAKILNETDVLKSILLNQTARKNFKTIDTERHLRKVTSLVSQPVDDGEWNGFADLLSELREKREDVATVHRSSTLKRVPTMSEFFTQLELRSLEQKSKRRSEALLKDYDSFIAEVDRLHSSRGQPSEEALERLKASAERYSARLAPRIEELNELTVKLMQVQQGSQQLKISRNIAKYFKEKLDQFISELLQKNEIIDRPDHMDGLEGLTDISDLTDLGDLEDSEDDTRRDRLEKRLKRERKMLIQENLADYSGLEMECEDEVKTGVDEVSNSFDDAKERHVEDLRKLTQLRLESSELSEAQRRDILRKGEEQITQYEQEMEREKVRQLERLRELVERKKRKKIELLKATHRNRLDRHKEQCEFERQQFDLLEDGVHSQEDTLTQIKSAIQQKLRDRKNFVIEKKESEREDLQDFLHEGAAIDEAFLKDKDRMVRNSLVQLKAKSNQAVLDTSVSATEKGNLMAVFREQNSDFKKAVAAEQSRRAQDLQDRVQALSRSRIQQLQERHHVTDENEVEAKVQDLRYIKQVLRDGGMEDETLRRQNFHEERKKQITKQNQEELEHLQSRARIKKEEIEAELETRMKEIVQEGNRLAKNMENALEEQMESVVEMKDRELQKQLDDQTLTGRQRDRLVLAHEYEMQQLEAQATKEQRKQLESLQQRLEEKKRRIEDRLRSEAREFEIENLTQQQKVIDEMQDSPQPDEPDDAQPSPQRRRMAAVRLTSDQKRAIEAVKRENAEKLGQLETHLREEEEHELRTLERESSAELDRIKRELREHNSNRLRVLEEKMRSDLEDANLDDAEQIRDTYSKDRQSLAAMQSEEYQRQQQALAERLEERMERIRKKKDAEMERAADESKDEEDRARSEQLLAREKARVIGLLDADRSLSVRSAVIQVVRPRHQAELEELAKRVERMDELKRVKEQIRLRKRHVEEESRLVQEIEDERELKFEDDELAAFESEVKSEREEVTRRITAEKKRLREEMERKLADEERKMKKEIEALALAAEEQQKQYVEEILQQKRAVHRLELMKRKNLASEAKEKLLAQHLTEVEVFRTVLEGEQNRQNEILRQKMESKERDRLAKKNQPLQDMSMRDVQKRIASVAESVDASLTAEEKKRREEAVLLERMWAIHVFYELRRIERKMFSQIPPVFKDEAQFSEFEADPPVLPPSYLTQDQRAVYNFSELIMDLLRTRTKGRVIQNVVVVRTVPYPTYKNNAFANSYWFHPETKTLHVRQSKLDHVGEFVMILVHAIAHAVVHNFMDDTNPHFLKVFYRLLEEINLKLFSDAMAASAAAAAQQADEEEEEGEV